ncbi:MAG: hypothetical protein OHK0029_07760 [Armatimonadaceae bacterium]
MATQAVPSVEQDVARARALALRYGWNAMAFQVVNPGIQHWFAPDGDGLIGYVCRAGVRVVAGAPICPEDKLPAVLAAFEAEAESHRERVCYLGAAGRLLALLDDRPEYSVVVLGAQPVWNPGGWAGIVAEHASLRAQVARAGNKGVVIREWSPEKAHNHPELHRCLNEWLQTRHLPPLHFLVEPQTLSRLTGRRIFVAERAGVPVGFINCSPVAARNGWLTEQFVRGKDAPNGTVEAMIDCAMRTLASEGATYVTMGLVPLSRHAQTSDRQNPLWLRATLAWVRAHGRRFYNFDGLDRFKAKFQPDFWEPIYCISHERRFSPRTLYAIADAFTGGSPIRAVLLGIGKAIRQEWRWLRERR